jgi:hypothetical protein
MPLDDLSGDPGAEEAEEAAEASADGEEGDDVDAEPEEGERPPAAPPAPRLVHSNDRPKNEKAREGVRTVADPPEVQTIVGRMKRELSIDLRSPRRSRA